MNVALDDIGLRLVRRVSPLTDVPDGPEEEDALALAAADLTRNTTTGFMIQMPFCSLYRLNSSRKIGYSLGRLYVSGRKS